MRPARESRCPGPFAILLLLARNLPTLAPQACGADSPSGFPRHLAPTVKVSFLSPSHPDRKGGGGRPDSTKKGRRARRSASRSLRPAPPAAPHPCACAALPTQPGRRCAPESLRREANWLGPWAASWRAGGQGAGHSRQPSEDRARLREPTVPAHAGPTASGCGFPGCLVPRPHAATEGDPRT